MAFFPSICSSRPSVREEIGSSRSRSVDSSCQFNAPPTSRRQSTIKKPSQSLRDISHLVHHYLTFSSVNSHSQPEPKVKPSTYIRRKKLRKKIQRETFLPPGTNESLSFWAGEGERVFVDEHIYQSVATDHDDARGGERHFFEQTSKLKSQLIEHESILQQLKEQLNQVDQQLTLVHDSSTTDRQMIKRRHTFNSLIDQPACPSEKPPAMMPRISSLFSSSSSSSLFALQLL